MFKVLSKVKILNSINKSSLENSFKLFTPNVKYFSSGHHSDSDGDDHGHHHSTSSSETSETEDHLSLLRKRAFSKLPKKFSVEEILASSTKPLTKAEEKVEVDRLFNNEKEYVNFLAKEFEKKANLKYPGYKAELETFKDRILDYDRLNAYQKEVQTLNIYLLSKLDKEREELTKAFQGSQEGTPLEQAKSRLNLMQGK